MMSSQMFVAIVAASCAISSGVVTAQTLVAAQSNTERSRNADASPQPFLQNPDPSKSWTLVETFSDEFNSGRIDRRKWITDMRPWGERAWSSDNLSQRDGKLFIKARYEPHTHRGNRYFYKLGILQSQRKTTYGYFEARIKGCSRFPGLCPAFWLYSNGRDKNPKYPKVTYSEIDIVEMLQAGWDSDLKRPNEVNRIDCNLHTRVINELGKEEWIRPQHLPDVCEHAWDAPWDPRDDYHVYACENTPERITWYIDGEKVAEEDNLYWHLPMSVTLTMELRPPLIAWAGVDGRAPVPDASTPEGFPTEMSVDYVRCWVRKPE
ncbi:kappa-carrageenase [Rhodopirellula sp. SWK7]|uniref:kappa-carrageenase n=1 Tax=Rhodopirellula sp. SWK7 TaxID=595460 RepID=UPI0002BE8BCE|nr:kappa-carrageenase [Rhodopirellula sp. SWK7]EMI44072.1 glycoside hydrolase family 16 [Rhodopirellula sp. SWK7]